MKRIVLAAAVVVTLAITYASAQATPCNDGWQSSSSGSGTCSHHGGEVGNSHVHHGNGY